MTDDERAAYRAACERMMTRLREGERLRVLIGDGTAEPASEIVLTETADRGLRAILLRGLTMEIGGGPDEPDPAPSAPDDPDPQTPAPAMAVNGDEVAGD